MPHNKQQLQLSIQLAQETDISSAYTKLQIKQQDRPTGDMQQQQHAARSTGAAGVANCTYAAVKICDQTQRQKAAYTKLQQHITTHSTPC